MSDNAKAEEKPNASAPADARLPVSAFAQLPFAEKLTLSPNGQRVAGLFAIEGEQVIGVFEATGKMLYVARSPDLTEIMWVRWANDDNVVLGVMGQLKVKDELWYVSRLSAVNVPTGKLRRLLDDLKGQNAADVLWWANDGSPDILVAAQNDIYIGTEGLWPSIYRVNVETGRRQVVERGRFGVRDWGVDSAGQVRFATRYNDDTTNEDLLYRSASGGPLRQVERARRRDDERLSVPALIWPDSDRGAVLTEDDKGRGIVAEVNLATGEQNSVMHALDGVDINGVTVNRAGDRIIALWTNDRKQPVRWLDTAMQQHQRKLESAAPGTAVTILSRSQDDRYMLVRFSTPDNPGLVYYYDTQSEDLRQFVTINDKIGKKRLSSSRYVQYQARDGLAIEGVLTTPRGRPRRNMPMIVMPHGGPWAQDELGYDYWVQFLAERGYAVLQPNFRGSTGYGSAFLKAGEGQMGLAMQDDLADGVRWAVNEGLADPARVCIVGASYGGYAAMWGLVHDPDLYRCAISIAGVSNLRREVNDFGSAARAKLYRSQWARMSDDFNAVSPIRAIDRIRAPLLLIHGKKDVTVDHGQSESMAAAMRRADKPVEFLSLPLADHYFTRQPDRLALLEAMDRFLAVHNPVD